MSDRGFFNSRYKYEFFEEIIREYTKSSDTSGEKKKNSQEKTSEESTAEKT
jgi:hypothetical protein